MTLLILLFGMFVSYLLWGAIMFAGKNCGCKHYAELLRSDDNNGNDDKNQYDADKFNISQIVGHQQTTLVQISAWLFGLTAFENPE